MEYQLPNESQISGIMPATQETKKKIPKIVFIVAGLFILMLLIGMWFLLFSKTPGGISESDLAQGTSVVLKENTEVKFKLNEEEHKIIVDSVKNDSVDISIQSEPITATLNIGETKKFDLDLNETYDISVKLNNITNNESDLYLKKIDELICVESWNCANWSVCVNSTQTRTCDDANDCGTVINKPAESQTCVVSEPETAEVDCSTGSETKIDCFIKSASTCTQSELTYTFNSNVVGWIQDSSNIYKITGFEGGKCELYERVISASGSYSDTRKQTLLSEGYSEEEITDAETLINQNLTDSIGNNRTCRVSTLELKNALTELKEYGADVSDSLCNKELYVELPFL